MALYRNVDLLYVVKGTESYALDCSNVASGSARAAVKKSKREGL